MIARALGLAVSTVGLVLRRLGLNRLALLEPKPAVVRYERDRPGEMIHLDIKKLGKINGIGHRSLPRGPGMHVNKGHGWDFLHVAVDDASRLAYTEILGTEGQLDTIAFLERALGWFGRLGVTERVMTDNGSAYRSKLFALQHANVRHVRTRPYTPRTNGKAERFIQSCLREWAYVTPFVSSTQRSHAAANWTNSYNLIGPHTGIGGISLWTRLNNLLGNDMPVTPRTSACGPLSCRSLTHRGSIIFCRVPFLRWKRAENPAITQAIGSGLKGRI